MEVIYKLRDFRRFSDSGYKYLIVYCELFLKLYYKSILSKDFYFSNHH